MKKAFVAKEDERARVTRYEELGFRYDGSKFDYLNRLDNGMEFYNGMLSCSGGSASNQEAVTER